MYSINQDVMESNWLLICYKEFLKHFKDSVEIKSGEQAKAPCPLCGSDFLIMRLPDKIDGHCTGSCQLDSVLEKLGLEQEDLLPSPTGKPAIQVNDQQCGDLTAVVAKTFRCIIRANKYRPALFRDEQGNFLIIREDDKERGPYVELLSADRLEIEVCRKVDFFKKIELKGGE